jgi:hypothetical protein
VCPCCGPSFGPVCGLRQPARCGARLWHSSGDGAGSIPRLHRVGDAGKPAQPSRWALWTPKFTTACTSVIGCRRISRFLIDLARPHVVGQDLSAGYATMAADEAREAAAEAWSEALVGDVADEPRRHGG